MPEVWGKDAAVFNPYRWFEEDGKSISYSPFSELQVRYKRDEYFLEMLTSYHVEYHSWNAGPRSCIGRALATYEGITISTAILQRFDVVLSDDSKTYEPLAAMNMVRCVFASTNDSTISNWTTLSRE
jgi:cytochrome P450